jgi:soluble lytic murein transglycosylase-like protein
LANRSDNLPGRESDMQRLGSQQTNQAALFIARSMKVCLAFAGGLLAILFGAGANASETSTSRAEVIHFGEAKPSGVMREDFRAMAGISEVQRDFVLRPQLSIASSSLPTDRIRIPRWMRPASTIESTRLKFDQIGSLSGCTARPYRPSNILGVRAERRRELLYPLVRQAACEAGIPIALMDALLIQESRYHPRATSPKGAFGLGQLMPATAKELGVDRYSLHGNLRGAARYLSLQLREFGRVDLALGAYNAGPSRVRASGGIPRIAETKNYIRIVLANWAALESNRDSSNARPASRSPVRSIWHGDFRASQSPLAKNN